MASIRQLLLVSSVIIACILVGMLAGGTGLMERKLDAQLQADGENAAATLALLIGSQADTAARVRVLDAAFQQGRFQALSLVGPDGAAHFQRRLPHASTADAPAWLPALVAIGPHEALRRIPDAGALHLVLDPGPAYDALWAHVLQWLWLALGLAAFWALFVAALLTRVRRALAATAEAE